jgi:hypothetical protein
MDTENSNGTRVQKLPDAAELIRQRNDPATPPEKRTLQAIADRYGATRQAVHKAIKKYQGALAASE